MCSTRPSELCLIDQNFEEVHNLQSPDKEKNVGATIHQNSVSLIRSLKRSITCNLLMKKNFLTDADSRTNSILERLCDLSFFFNGRILKSFMRPVAIIEGRGVP